MKTYTITVNVWEQSQVDAGFFKLHQPGKPGSRTRFRTHGIGTLADYQAAEPGCQQGGIVGLFCPFQIPDEKDRITVGKEVRCALGIGERSGYRRGPDLAVRFCQGPECFNGAKGVKHGNPPFLEK